jgi:Fe2+ or Zn2+ uptake regulation protein
MKKIGNKSVLNAFLEDLGDTKRQEGEKTAYEILQELIEDGIDTTIHSVRNRLEGMVNSGKLKRRKVLINGKYTNLFSEP